MGLIVVGLHNEISDFSSPLLLLYTSHLLLFNLPIYQLSTKSPNSFFPSLSQMQMNVWGSLVYMLTLAKTWLVDITVTAFKDGPDRTVTSVSISSCSSPLLSSVFNSIHYSGAKGFPLWTLDILRGSTHCIFCLRLHLLLHVGLLVVPHVLCWLY